MYCAKTKNNIALQADVNIQTSDLTTPETPVHNGKTFVYEGMTYVWREVPACQPVSVYDKDTLWYAYQYAQKHNMNLHLDMPGNRAVGTMRLPLLSHMLACQQYIQRRIHKIARKVIQAA
jgi:hypothetical protein